MAEAYATPNKTHIGRRVMSMRIASGMSREVLAEKVGISAQFIADIEYGNKGMSLTTFYVMCQALNVTPDYLLAGNRYSQEYQDERSMVCEEIMEAISSCDVKHLKGISGIIRIYLDGRK